MIHKSALKITEIIFKMIRIHVDLFVCRLTNQSFKHKYPRLLVQDFWGAFYLAELANLFHIYSHMYPVVLPQYPLN